MKVNKDDILTLLKDVKDPEIPVLSLVDLGVITDVLIGENGHVTVKMTPTFAGCPAMDYMKQDVEEKLTEHGLEDHEVIVSFENSWNSNKISDEGRKKLKEFGLAPPPVHDNLIVDIDIISHATCPNCGSENTMMKTPFGPTLCRSIHYCKDCKETFEQFKPI